MDCVDWDGGDESGAGGPRECDARTPACLRALNLAVGLELPGPWKVLEVDQAVWELCSCGTVNS
jgi:hypothetical protein